MSDKKTAQLYRMSMDSHICPFGLKSKALLQQEGYAVEDHLLKTREETDAFQAKHNVDTTPQAFIDGKRIGGFDALIKHFGRTSLKQEGKSYTPVFAVFATAFLLMAAIFFGPVYLLTPAKFIALFIGFAMCLLAMLKLQDLFSFSNQFLGYDLLAQKWVPYSFIYPFAEMIAGLGMIMMVKITAPIAVLIGGIGAVSVIKAVYIQKRDLKCACVGGGSSVPLGALTLTENALMFFGGIWMLLR